MTDLLQQIKSLEHRIASLTQANAEMTKQLQEASLVVQSVANLTRVRVFDPALLCKGLDAIATELADAKKDSEWQPISEAPEYVDGQELQRLLVYSTDFGVTIGNVIRWPDGTFACRVQGQCGNWPITHFRALPTPPAIDAAALPPATERKD